jgi:DNA replication protein DnaC
MNHILDQLSDLRLHGLKDALIEQMEQAHLYGKMAFEDRLSHLIERETSLRKDRTIKRMRKAARLKYPDAHIADVDFRSGRGLQRSQLEALIGCGWLKSHRHLIITGPTGTGKTFLACALGNSAMASGYGTHYIRIAKLLSQIALVRAEGSYLNWLKRLSRFPLIILDDLGLSSLTTTQTQELLEIIEERDHRGSMIITSQLPVKEWYSYFNNPTLADAIMDRAINNAHRIQLKGDSMRKIKIPVSYSDTFT